MNYYEGHLNNCRRALIVCTFKLNLSFGKMIPFVCASSYRPRGRCLLFRAALALGRDRVCPWFLGERRPVCVEPIQALLRKKRGWHCPRGSVWTHAWSPATPEWGPELGTPASHRHQLSFLEGSLGRPQEAAPTCWGALSNSSATRNFLGYLG